MKNILLATAIGLTILFLLISFWLYKTRKPLLNKQRGYSAQATERGTEQEITHDNAYGDALISAYPAWPYFKVGEAANERLIQDFNSTAKDPATGDLINSDTQERDSGSSPG